MTGSRSRRFTFAALLAAVVLFAALPARAQLSTGNATQYSIQVTEVALCTDSTCATNTVIGSATKTFDIASADVGAELGQFADTSNLPIGTTFTNLRVTLSRTITIDGSVTVAGIAGNTCRTSTSNDGAAAGDATTAGDGAENTGGTSPQDLFVPDPLSFAGNTVPTTASYTNEGISVPLSAATLQFTVALTSPVTITAQPPTIRIAFNTQDALGAFDGGGTCKMVRSRRLPPSPSISGPVPPDLFRTR